MKRELFKILSCLLLVSPILGFAQENKTSPRVVHRKANPVWKPAEGEDGCTRQDITGELIYRGVGASYVGGTIPKFRTGASFLSRVADPYGGTQLKRKGRLALSPRCILFAFKGQQKDVPAWTDYLPEGSVSGTNLHIFACVENPDLSDETGRKCTAPGEKDKRPKTWVVAIPYAPIAVLSRSRYSTADLLSISTGYAVAAAGLLAALSQGIKNTHTLEVSLGGATGGMLLFYYIAVLRPRLTENYMAIFVENRFAPSEDDDTDKTHVEFQGDAPKLSGKATIKKMSDELFAESDVILLRVNNYHDYYNISLILNAKTGLTFVSENAEKPTK